MNKAPSLYTTYGRPDTSTHFRTVLLYKLYWIYNDIEAH